MLPSELAKKIRYIQIYTRRAVNDALAGEYQSVFKGRGMEFAEVRQYQIGDDVRSIDWNVTARTGEPYVKQFVEERELTVIFAVDLSASGMFGSSERLKKETAAEVCALLAFSAVKNNDKVGLIIFTEEVEKFIPPGKGNTHVLRVIREVLNFSPEHSGTNIKAGLDYMGRVATKRSVVFLISDFLDQGYERELSMLSRKHDMVAISITDPREQNLPSIGLIEFQDPESGETMVFDTSSRRLREKCHSLALQRQASLREFFNGIGVDQVEITNGEDYVKPLVRFFRRREQRSSM